MGRTFKLPNFGSDDLNITARQYYYLAVSFALSSLIFLIEVSLVTPNLFRRALVIAIVTSLVCLAVMVLVTNRRLKTAGVVLITSFWSIITLGCITAGGVSTPIVIGYVIVIMIGGFTLKGRTIVLVTGLCILTLVLISVAQINSLLPEPIQYTPLERINVYIYFLIQAALVQGFNVRNTKELLKQTIKNETLYRSLLENIPATTYINGLGPDSPTEYVSPQVEKLLGYSRETFTNDPLFWTKILHPDDAPNVLQHNRHTSETLQAFEMEYRVIDKNNRVVWLKDEAILIEEEGQPAYWLGVWTDVTSRKQAEEEQENLIDGMTKRTVQLQTAADVARAATSILDINELLPNIVQLIRDHFEYYYVGIFLMDEANEWAILRAATGEMGQKMIKAGHRLKVQESSMIGWCITHRQARIALDVGEDAVRFANPLLPLTRSEIALPLITHGEIIGAMTIQSEQPAAFSAVDITALQAMADLVTNALENARVFTERVSLTRELESRNEELERFTYTVSHDLRSPLVTMRGFLGYLRQDAESRDMERFDNDLNRIAKAVDRMQVLLNELLELSRIGRIANPPEVVSFGEIVRETVELLAGPIEAGNICLNIASDFPLVYADRLRISEVIQNLLSNAIKFMGDQSNPSIEVNTKGTDVDGKPIFYIRDNGIGIEPQYHDRIFGLFNRLNPEIDGTGIGLTLVKRIIETHQGHIWIESEPGQGSTFFFTLPTLETTK